MLFGSDYTLRNIGHIPETFAEVQQPILFVSPIDIFGEKVDILAKQNLPLTQIKSIIERRMPDLIDQYAIPYRDVFRKATSNPEFVGGLAQQLKEMHPACIALEELFEQKSAIMPGIVFIPTELEPEDYIAAGTGIWPGAITGALGSKAIWQSMVSSHEVWHLLRPEAPLMMMDESLAEKFYAAVEAAPEEFDLYKEIMCDHFALDAAYRAGAADQVEAAQAAYVNTRLVSAFQRTSNAHTTGLTLDYISSDAIFPRFSVMQKAVDDLWMFSRKLAVRHHFEEQGIRSPTEKQVISAFKEKAEFSLETSIFYLAYLIHHKIKDPIVNHNAAITLCAINDLCPQVVEETLLAAKDEFIEQAKNVPRPIVEPEAPYYQAALELFSNRTTLEEQPDGSTLVIRQGQHTVKLVPEVGG